MCEGRVVTEAWEWVGKIRPLTVARYGTAVARWWHSGPEGFCVGNGCGRNCYHGFNNVAYCSVDRLGVELRGDLF